MSLKCQNCGATYKGKISPFSKSITCPYCYSAIVVSSAGPVEAGARKEFDIEQFKAFLGKRGISTFDTISGILKLGNQEVVIDGDGAVSGPEPLRSRAEKWLYKFMTQK